MPSNSVVTYTLPLLVESLMDFQIPSPDSTTEPLSFDSIIGCMLLLFVIKVSLIVLGFERTRRVLSASVAKLPVDQRGDMTLLARADRRVAAAASFLPGRLACLEQSLALYYLLRRKGIAANFRVGVVADPFVAHAWVEYRGQAINDSAEHVAAFAQLPIQLP